MGLKHWGLIPIVLSLLSVFKPPASPTVPVTFFCPKLSFQSMLCLQLLCCKRRPWSPSHKHSASSLPSSGEGLYSLKAGATT